MAITVLESFAASSMGLAVGSVAPNGEEWTGVFDIALCFERNTYKAAAKLLSALTSKSPHCLAAPPVLVLASALCVVFAPGQMLCLSCT